MAAERKSRPLTTGMLAILKCKADGKDLSTIWASGRSYRGGLTTALYALQRRGLLTHENKLTDAGRAASGVPPSANQIPAGAPATAQVAITHS